MSIKKLFDSTNKITQYADFDNEKGAYSTVESSANAKNLTIEQATFVPDLDYSNPEKFAFYGSAYLYYKSAFDNVSDYYPYDGSLAEQSAFYNKMLPVDKYVFNKKYPRTTGYATIAAGGWGTIAATTKYDGYGLPSTLEYIAFKGGPHTGSQGTSLKNHSLDKHSSKIDRSNVYDDDIYTSAGLPSDYGKGTRLSNLRSNFDDGVTVEFWLKTGSINTALTEKQVVFDLWNSEVPGPTNNSYGRIRIELVSGSSSGLPTKIMTYTVQSGSTKKTSTIGATGSATFSDWKHYAVAFYNTGSSFITKLYVDGKLDEIITSAGAVSELNPVGMQARLGALATSPSGSAAPAGAGKLSGSIDEFRFWKVARDASQIGVNYFDRIGGGSNTDISNATLGVYFKFNEGITGVTTTDNIVADYSGRISNGTWTGYTATSRNTGSAIVSASAAAAEFEDPIIRENHPDYISVRKSLLDIGSHYDSTNHSGFINHAPSWVIENHEDVTNDNLKIISHIVGSYFDNLYILTREFPKFKQVNYLSESASPIPFANHLPQSLGLYVPDIFIDATVQEQLMNRNETEIFQSNLDETKNLIYQNLYNNLANIYKAKGTENAFKNVLRCFNIDDEMVQLKIYSDNNIYEIKNNLRQVISANKSVNFNKLGQTDAVVYQRKDTTNGNSRGFISGSAGGATGGAEREKYYGFTAEADVIFPRFFSTKDTIDRSFKQVSLFGVVGLAHPETTAHQQGTNTSTPRTGSASRLVNFQVYAIRDEAKSKNVYFKLESSGSANPFPTLTSSNFSNVYDNSRWNLSVRLKPTSVGLSGFVSGSSLTYDLIFRGVNSVLGVVKNSFEVSSSISATTGSNFLQNHKRIYAGAFRNNLTGTMIHPSDVKMSNVKYWLKHLENSDLELHLNDVENSGISGSYKNISALDTSTNTFNNLNKDTLALEWNFDLLTGSDASGNFVTQDFSSGSSTIRNNYGWLGKITGYQHNGYGNFFNASSTDVVDRERVNSFKFVDPEEVVSSNMISILNDDDELLGFEQTIPNYVITAEKSMYRAISEEMLIFFAGVVDFNNIVGAPVNRYRGRYKDLEFMREAFFRRVKETKDIEKFISYYKWFDSAITEIFSQLVPASANFVEGVTNLIESHVLERNKYRTPFPSIEAKQPDPATSIYGIGESSYSYDTGFSPLPSSPRRTDIQVDYWKKRAERNAVEITSGDATIDTQRDNIRRIINSNPVLSSSRDDIFVNDDAGTQYQPELYARRNYQQLSQIHTDEPNSNTYGGGTNFSKDKNIQFSKIALSPGGPVNTAGGVYVPQNILLSFVNDFVAITDFKDPSKTPWKKVKRVVPVDYGRHHDDKDGYYHVKSSKAFPFNIISSSLNSGYQSEVSAALGLNLEITNVHNDVYGDDQEKPLQGIFTEHNVGGNQHRHAPLNTGADNNNNRPEAWRILLGTCTVSPSGAIGMVGADYPMSPAYVAPPGANQPYPHADYPRATHFRDMVAKRPLNIRNIKITGSSVLGNYRNTYEYVHTFGAFSNPRQFVEQQPTLPTNVFHLRASSSTSVRTFLDTKPTRDHDTVNREHFNFVNDYSVSYLTGTTNKSVIKTRFSAPGGIEVMTPGYTDFRSDEFSVYNALPYKNLSVIKPSQGPSGSISETFGMRVSDIHNLDFGLRSHLARHTARFGRDSNLALNPGAAYAESPGMHKVHRNNLQRMVPLYNEVDAITGYSTGSVYDNFFVKHQIPRSSRQYAWITASLVSTNGHVGFTPDDFKISSSAGYVDVYDFITASQVGSAFVGGQRRFGIQAPHAGYVPQVSDLNLNIYEPVTSSTNTLGQGAARVRGYINKSDALVGGAPVAVSPNAFNNLMFKRGNQYGFPSWKQMRTAQHPIVRQQRAENKLQVMVENAPRTFEVSPVSLNNKIQEIGVRAINGTRYVMRATHQTTFFDTPELNNLLISPDANARITPMQAVIASAYRSEIIKNIDYIAYTEDIFPSGKNQFTSHSSERIGYSNDYWHSNREQRNKLGATLYTGSPSKPRITGSYLRESSFGYDVSASAWPLDPQTNFLSRTFPKHEQRAYNDIAQRFGSIPHKNYLWLGTGSAGELQNTWQSYFIFGNTYARKYQPGNPKMYFVDDTFRAYNAIASPLYARKHLLGSPISVTNPNSITNHLAGQNVPSPAAAKLGVALAGGPAATPFRDRFGNLISCGDTISMHGGAKIFAGEALWEAGDHAGIFTKIERHLSGTNITREAMPSVPAYDSYSKFVDSIKRQSRDKSIVPEYRISRNLPEYLDYGSPFVPNKQDHFDIPGTDINSSAKAFYVDYSNSEFLKYFASVSRDSGLQPAEIQLVCSASIKFHPYKGFFPAQRTMEVAKEFKNSYADLMRVKIKEPSSVDGMHFNGKNVLDIVPGAFRPVMQAYFSPGILYNTIKSGIAVDYPILYNRYKMLPSSHYRSYIYSGSQQTPAADSVLQRGYVPEISDYMIVNRTGEFITASADTGLGTLSSVNAVEQRFGEFWDQRIPFEALIDPNMLANTQFADCEVHQSATINAVASYEATSDSTYTLMAKNFFGGVADFYLKDSQFTSLRSETVYKDDYRFDSGSVYMARIKMRRSTTGSRDYTWESGSFMPESYTQGGGTALLPRLITPDDTDNIMYDASAYFELPQDPMYAPNFYETFTMYSRPSAFGPPVAGHVGNISASHGYRGRPFGVLPSAPYTGSAFQTGSTMQIMDSMKGYNWSFTPPYYNGEAWADLIFRPQEGIVYDLERILAETSVNYWRVDPGPKLKTWGVDYNAAPINNKVGDSGSIGAADQRQGFGYPLPGSFFDGFTTLIHDPQLYEQYGAVNTAPYGGSSINSNAMQLSASMNLFGVERVFKKTMTETIAGEVEITNEVVGKKWVISTKFETPMLNFNDKFQAQPVTASLTTTGSSPMTTDLAIGDLSTSTKTLPTYGSSSAPNGMWHQFGSLPTDKKTGVFIEINDMPKNWLRNHYNVRLSGSVYNNNTPDYTGVLAKEGQVGSLRDLCGFKKSNTRSRIGELKESVTIKEAIVAVPYMIASTDEHIRDSNNFVNFEGKYLFRLPVDGATVSSGAAEAINKQIQAMNDYIVPPQFDFVNYPDNVAPVTMYFFEFSYTFDKDDLSYMWQNLMPRNHEKGLFDSATAEHTLGAEFPLEAADILNNPNMRWMVFKVKQRSQADYYDYVNTQAGDRKLDRDDDSPLQFNWPYDYCSIIEFVGVDAGVLFNNKRQTPGESTTLKYGGSITSEDKLPPENKKIPNREADSQERTPNREADSQERTPNRERDQATTLAAADAPSSIDSSAVSSTAARTLPSGDY